MLDSKMSSEPPPYSENISLTSGSIQYGYADSTSHGQRLVDQLTTTRAQHLIAILHQHILPLIESRASRGLSRTVIALFPSDVFVSLRGELDRQTHDASGMSLYTADDGEILDSKIWLSGAIDSTVFWTQSGVIDDLERMLKEKLLSSDSLLPADKDSGRSTHTESDQLVPPPAPPVTRQKSRGWFSRNRSTTSDIVSPITRTTSVPPSKTEQVAVKVKLDDVTLKRMSDFGLYETTTRPDVVVVRVDVRT